MAHNKELYLVWYMDLFIPKNRIIGSYVYIMPE